MFIREHTIQCNNVSVWNLRPFGDIQFGASGFQEALWKRCADEIKEDPFALTIGMGDYSDFWRPTNQTKLELATAGDGDFKDSIDMMHQSHMQKVFEKLAPVINSKRCLGLLAGHHDYTYASGMTSTQWLCDKLRVPFLGRMCYVKLIFQAERRRVSGKKQTGRIWSVIIHAQHGDGGAGFTGGDIANLERKTFPYRPDADIFLRGHSTKRWTAPVTRERPVFGKFPRIVNEDVYLVNTGGFMSGYPLGETSYVEKKNMPPANLGYAVVHLALERHGAIEGRAHEQVRITVTQ